MRVKVNEKTSIISTYLNLWAPTAGPLQGLVVPGLAWSRTLSILLSIYGENVCLHVFT